MKHPIAARVTVGAFLALAVISFQCSKNVAGGETINEKTAIVYLPDGKTPAVGATVSVFSPADTTRVPAYETQTDSKGAYAIQGLAKGVYNIAAKQGSLVAFQDSVYISGTSSLKDDTLDDPGSICGYVGLQPNHDPRIVMVNAMGTYAWANVDANGKFILNDLGAGKYTLRFIASNNEYTPTYVGVTVISGKKDTLADTVWLIYTGIPVVTGVRVEYDTVHGVAKLTWRKPAYRDVYDYLIYRDDEGVMGLSSMPVSNVTDTFFCDTVLPPRGSFGRNDTFPSIDFTDSGWVDTTVHSYRYRIKIRNNSAEEGSSYGFTSVKAISPYWAMSIVRGHYLTTSVPSICTLRVVPGPWLKAPYKVEWDVGGTGTFVRSGGLTKVITVDSIVVRKPVVVRCTDTIGRVVVDTISISTVLRWKLQSGSQPPFVRALCDAVFKNKIWVIEMGGPNVKIPLYSYAFGKSWISEMDSLPFLGSSAPSYSKFFPTGFIAYHGELWFWQNMINLSGSRDTLRLAWHSLDGQTWSLDTVAYPLSDALMHPVIRNDTLFALSNRPCLSIDGIHWTGCGTLPSDIASIDQVFKVGDTINIIGTIASNGTIVYNNPIWYKTVNFNAYLKCDTIQRPYRVWTVQNASIYLMAEATGKSMGTNGSIKCQALFRNSVTNLMQPVSTSQVIPMFNIWEGDWTPPAGQIGNTGFVMAPDGVHTIE